MAGCNPQWWERLSAFHDGACSPVEREAVSAHLLRCQSCAAGLSQLRSLGGALKRLGARSQALPRHLARPSRRRWPTRALAAAAGVLLVAGALFGTATWPVGIGQALAEDLERHHLHAFTRKTPCEFESADPSEVEAWVAANTPFEVEVPQLEGATLLGARRCRLNGELAISLLYRRGEHPVTLFLPSPGSEAGKAAARFSADGARCTRSPRGERICAGGAALAVSDLPEERLISLVDLEGR